jgi:hypothetical protein
MENIDQPQMPNETLSIADALQVAWAIIWPLALLDVVIWLPEDNLGLRQQWVEMVGFLYDLASLFLIVPWVIRRMVRLNFRGFHLLVGRHSGEQSRNMVYSQSFAIAWLLIWRTGVILAVIELIFWLVRGARAEDNPFNNTAQPGLTGMGQLLIGQALALAIFALWMIKAAIAKPYTNFSLRVKRMAVW